MTVKDVGDYRTGLLVWVVLLALGCGICGCSSMGGYFPPGYLPYHKLVTLYQETLLQQSSSLDILRRMKALQGTVDPKQVDRELITQSDTVIASAGRSKKDTKAWFTLVAFDKYNNTAQRKYFFYMDEKASVSPTRPTRCLIPNRTVLVFDARAQITDVLASPHTSEQQRKISIVEFVAQQLQSDIKHLGVESEQMRHTDIAGVNGMFMNQVFRDALNELRKFPVLTRELHGVEGVEFENMSIEAGRLRLLVEDDQATVRIEVGLPASKGSAVFSQADDRFAVNYPSSIMH